MGSENGQRGAANRSRKEGLGSGNCVLVLWPRAEERANVNADSEREAIKLQRNAAAIVDFQIEIGTRLDFQARIEAVVTGETRAAGLHTGGFVALSIP